MTRALPTQGWTLRGGWIVHAAAIADALPRTITVLHRAEALAWSGAMIVAGPISAGHNPFPEPAVTLAETIAFEANLPGSIEELVCALPAPSARRDVPRQRVRIAARPCSQPMPSTVWFTAGHVVHLSGSGFAIMPRRISGVLPMRLSFALSVL